jgi:hypothetical protein
MKHEGYVPTNWVDEFTPAMERHPDLFLKRWGVRGFMLVDRENEWHTLVNIGDVVGFSQCFSFGVVTILHDPAKECEPLDFSHVPEQATMFNLDGEGVTRRELADLLDGEPQESELELAAWHWEDGVEFELIADQEAELGARFKEVMV